MRYQITRHSNQTIYMQLNIDKKNITLLHPYLCTFKTFSHTCSRFRWASSPLTLSTAALNLASLPVEAASISAILDSFSATSTCDGNS